MSRTKIICTLGPVSSSKSILTKMVLSGLNVARLNFSHGLYKEHKAKIRILRDINKARKSGIKILQDLEGFRIRIGELKGHKPIQLKKGSVIWLAQENILGNGNVVPFDYEGDLKVIKAGQHVYIEDGKIALRALKSDGKRLKCEVVIPGLIKEHKGVNIPEAKLTFSSLTQKDKDDLEFGVENKVDWIAQSFVRNKEDILEIKNVVGGRLPGCQYIAKIENREALNNIDEIIDVCDGIMVARGDLGISVPIYEIPFLQKEIIKKCNKAGKFVITATQMLEHMTEDIWPTRAEVTDVANAILDGTDYVMLSEETAAGKYPLETVKMMKSIVDYAEAHMNEHACLAIKENSL